MSVSVEPRSDKNVLFELEALATSHRARLAFPAWLERRFEAETGARYRSLLSRGFVRTALYYNLFLAADVLLTPDSFALAAALHFLVVTPILLAIAALCAKTLPPLARDAATAFVPALISAQVLCVFSASAAPTAAHYLYFVAISVMTFNTSMRFRFRSALASSAISLAAFVLTLLATQKVPNSVATAQVFSLLLCAVVSLRSAHQSEREWRRVYLRALRDRLKIAEIDAEANRDALTGVANRRGLEIAVRATWLAEDLGAPIAAILFDVDRFKAYNDYYGHPAGDACLREIAAAASGVLRGRDAVLARIGGEEFMALLKGVAAAEAERVAEQLRGAVLALDIAHAGDERRRVSASFGVAHSTLGDSGFEALTAAADAALYAAKSSGRNRVHCALAA